MSTARVPIAERQRYRVELNQPDVDELHLAVVAPDGRRAEWHVLPVRDERWVIDRITRQSKVETFVRHYDLCPTTKLDRDGRHRVIRSYPDYDKATSAAMLRARHWLGSCWGLRGPARRLP